MSEELLWDAAKIEAVLRALAGEMAATLPLGDPIMVLGVANGGVPLAGRLVPLLEESRPTSRVVLGTLNPLFHRDDIAERPIPLVKYETDLPMPVEGTQIVLVEDVIESGRTVRAALGEVFSHGRPARVWLAALADRPSRRVPIQPDFCGASFPDLVGGRLRLRLGPGGPSSEDGLYWQRVPGPTVLPAPIVD